MLTASTEARPGLVVWGFFIYPLPSHTHIWVTLPVLWSLFAIWWAWSEHKHLHNPPPKWISFRRFPLNPLAAVTLVTVWAARSGLIVWNVELHHLPEDSISVGWMTALIKVIYLVMNSIATVNVLHACLKSLMNVELDYISASGQHVISCGSSFAMIMDCINWHKLCNLLNHICHVVQSQCWVDTHLLDKLLNLGLSAAMCSDLLVPVDSLNSGYYSRAPCWPGGYYITHSPLIEACHKNTYDAIST